MRALAALIPTLWGLACAAQAGPALGPAVEALLPGLDAFYQELHRDPELSGRETRTAARCAARLREAGCEVTTGVGGGVVGVLRNGDGPTVLLRTELDALPVTEATGLACASATPGIMHACGHDAHMAIWAGTARLLASRRDLWRGTALFVGQPAEETCEGAQAMIRAGLFTRFPKPAYALALHDTVALPAGKVSWTAGWTMAAVTSVDVTLHGRGGHGARPDAAVDPVVLAARVVLALQTLISREKDPLEPAVLSVGSIHGGSKHNILPDQVRLQMTVRAYEPAVLQKLLAGIERVCKAEARAAGAPRDPEVVISEPQAATWNDPALARRIAARLARDLGPSAVVEGRPDMVSEDFGDFGKAAGIPSVLLRLGAVAPERFQAAQAAGEALPGLHAGTFAPDRPGTLRTGVLTLTLAALDLLQKEGLASTGGGGGQDRGAP